MLDSIFDWCCMQQFYDQNGKLCQLQAGRKGNNWGWGVVIEGPPPKPVQGVGGGATDLGDAQRQADQWAKANNIKLIGVGWACVDSHPPHPTEVRNSKNSMEV